LSLRPELIPLPYIIVKTMIHIIFIYKFGLSVCLFVCLSVCLYPINVKTAEPIGPKFFCGTSRDPMEGLWMIEILNICLHHNSIFIKFLEILNIHEIFCENPRIIFVLFYDVHKENMFTVNLEDGREAPSKACIVNVRIVKIDQCLFKRCWKHIYTSSYTLSANLLFQEFWIKIIKWKKSIKLSMRYRTFMNLIIIKRLKNS